MSEQSKILDEMQEIIMKILKSGAATVEEGNRIDELEELLYQQKSFQEIEHDEFTYLGEAIANLFFNNKQEEAIDELVKNEIIPEDFFGFLEYHFEDESDIEMFDESFKEDIKKGYASKC